VAQVFPYIFISPEKKKAKKHEKNEGEKAHRTHIQKRKKLENLAPFCPFLCSGEKKSFLCEDIIEDI
jgi:hypothetical protein